ncbi:MAG: hypothetical protein RID91_13135 [Azospirillaceae bacterium]
MNRKFLYRAYGGLAIFAGIGAFIFGHPYIEDNSEAMTVIVTVFSILAGFLIAVMTLLGDQSLVPGGWKIIEKQRKTIEAKLIRQKWLFFLYLFTLLVIFLTTLTPAEYVELKDWLERVYLGLSVTAFILSFRLPSTLMEIQVSKVDAITEARYNKSSKLDRS